MNDTIVFIDGPNIRHGIEDLRKEVGLELYIDYEKVLDWLKQEWHIYQAFFYTAYDPQNEKQAGFLRMMQDFGYKVVPKKLKTLPDGTLKGDVDPEIITDMMTIPDKFEECKTIILLSGDDDFVTPLERLSSKGYRTVLICFSENTGMRLTGRALKNATDEFIHLEEILEKMDKESRRRVEGKIGMIKSVEEDSSI